MSIPINILYPENSKIGQISNPNLHFTANNYYKNCDSQCTDCPKTVLWDFDDKNCLQGRAPFQNQMMAYRKKRRALMKMIFF